MKLFARSSHLLFAFLDYGYIIIKMQNFFDVQVGSVQQIQVNTNFSEQTKLQLPQVQIFCQKQRNSCKKNDYTASLFYISQYLSLEDQEIYQQHPRNDQFHKQIQIDPNFDSPKNLPLQPPKKLKSRKTTYNSPFHNYQKHLNNYLKKLIVLPSIANTDHEFKILARDIWNIFLSTQVKTKLVLHLVFSEGSQKIVKEETLRKLGFLDLYRRHDEAVINRAKNYLSQLAVVQIDYVNLEGYLKTTKIQNTDRLVDYILNFKRELERGHLKRRIQMNESQF